MVMMYPRIGARIKPISTTPPLGCTQRSATSDCIVSIHHVFSLRPTTMWTISLLLLPISMKFPPVIHAFVNLKGFEDSLHWPLIYFLDPLQFFSVLQSTCYYLPCNFYSLPLDSLVYLLDQESTLLLSTQLTFAIPLNSNHACKGSHVNYNPPFFSSFLIFYFLQTYHVR